MNSTWILFVILVLPLIMAQNVDLEEDRGLHKRRRPQQGGPCGGYGAFRDNGEISEDGRSVKLVAALGGAAAGYYLGMKHQKQPVINNVITLGGGGYPCGGGGGVAPLPVHGGGGGLLANHLGGGGLLGNHLGGLSGPRYGGVNWDRTVRQFNREVIRPISRWF